MHFGYAESEIGGELRCFEKTELRSRYAFLDRQCIQMWDSCVQECQKIWQRVADRAGVACKKVFSQLVLCIPSANLICIFLV